MASGLVKIIQSLLTGWNSFQRLHISVQAEESDFQISAPRANLIKIKTYFRLYFDELEHNFTENSQKQRT